MRLMAPFSMKCISCGEFIYKGRKFNARKETTDERYFSIAIYRFYIRCTRCSGEITFKTDPKNMDYVCEGGAKRNFEVWRQKKKDGNDDDDGGNKDDGDGDDDLETEEERLERLVREEEERGAMANLETKVLDAKREMEIADALDEIRTRNARNERARVKGDGDVAAFAFGRGGVVDKEEEERRERERIEKEDDEAAKRAFMKIEERQLHDDGDDEDEDEDDKGFVNNPSLSLVPGDRGRGGGGSAFLPAIADSAKKMPPPLTFKREVKKKKDFSAALGIKKKVALV